MKVIDADAHVIENESTWDYMLESEKAFRPKIVGAANGKDAFDYWMIDGRVIPRNNVGRDLPVESREMSDLSARIKHMDELGIDVQVIYPTFFITPVSRRPTSISPCRAATTAGWRISSRSSRTVSVGCWCRRCRARNICRRS